jgi:hypothetical protein
MSFQVLQREINIDFHKFFSRRFIFVLESSFQGEVEMAPGTVVVSIFFDHSECEVNFLLMDLSMLSQPDSITPGMIVFLIFLEQDHLSFKELAPKIIAQLCEKSFLFPDLKALDLAFEAVICKILLCFQQFTVFVLGEDVHLLEVPCVIVPGIIAEHIFR